MLQDDKLDVLQELSGYYDVERTRDGGNAYRLGVSTPAHKFFTLLTPLNDSPWFLDITARDFFDEKLAVGLLEFVRMNKARLDLEQAGSILEGFHVTGYTFDTTLVVGPAGHDSFKVESPRLHARTLVVLPIYRCEFSGHENAEFVKLIRSEFVPTIDWKRKPAPQIWMKYSSLRMNTRSHGKKLGLATLDVLLYELKELPGSRGSFVEIKSFKGEQCKLVSEGELVVIESPLLAQPMRVPAREPLGDWMEAFVTLGFQRLKELLPRL